MHQNFEASQNFQRVFLRAPTIVLSNTTKNFPEFRQTRQSE